MKLTKYQHACFTIEKDGQILVVDPGGFSSDFIPPEHITAVIVTHTHGDHFDHEQLEAIIDKNPDAVIFGPEAVTGKIEAFQTKTVTAGSLVEIGPFSLEFFGGDHAVIHPSFPPAANVGVLINDLLYYPGDSFTVPQKPVDTLALPIAAPWLKISETLDFFATVQPRLAFPTHDAILSVEGKEVADANVGTFAHANGLSYQRIEAPIEI